MAPPNTDEEPSEPEFRPVVDDLPEQLTKRLRMKCMREWRMQLLPAETSDVSGGPT